MAPGKPIYLEAHEQIALCQCKQGRNAGKYFFSVNGRKDNGFIMFVNPGEVEKFKAQAVQPYPDTPKWLFPAGKIPYEITTRVELAPVDQFKLVRAAHQSSQQPMIYGGQTPPNQPSQPAVDNWAPPTPTPAPAPAPFNYDELIMAVRQNTEAIQTSNRAMQQWAATIQAGIQALLQAQNALKRDRPPTATTLPPPAKKSKMPPNQSFFIDEEDLDLTDKEDDGVQESQLK